MQICLLEAEKRTQDMIRIIGRGAPHGKGTSLRRVQPLAGLSVKMEKKSWLFFLVLL